MLIAVVVCITVFIVVFLVLDFGATLLEAILAATFWSVCIGLVILIFAATNVGYLRRKMGNVEFDGETVSVFDHASERNYSAKLADCRWFVGSQTWATIPNRNNLCGSGTGEAILIAFPDTIRTPELRVYKTIYAEGPVIIAVGLTFETRFQWEQAIERLNVERDDHRASLPSPLSQEFATLLVMLGLPGSFLLGFWGSITVQNLLIQWLVPGDIARGISFPLFVPGVIYLILFLVVVPSLGRKQRDVHLIKDQRRLSAQWNAVLGLCIVQVFTIPGLWQMVGRNDWTVRSAIIATAICIVMAIVSIAVFWRLLAEPHKDTAEQKPE